MDLDRSLLPRIDRGAAEAVAVVGPVPNRIVTGATANRRAGAGAFAGLRKRHVIITAN